MPINTYQANRTNAGLRSVVPPLSLSLARSLKKGTRKLALVLLAGLLLSCSHAPANKSAKSDSQSQPSKAASTQKAAPAQARQDTGPRPGDTRMVDGVEYVYGKNVKYMVNPGEPEYTWVRKDQYFPDANESSRTRVFTPSRQQGAESASQAPSPGQDEADRKWASIGEDGNRIQYFYDKAAVVFPTQGFVRIWKKREFPSGAAQREIVSLDEIDCREARYHSLEVRVTYREGMTRNFAQASPWTKVYQDSAEEYLMNQFCQ
ncbi:MAG TPA: hypothetical protein VMT71_14095 [Syntrophorhabdales bacterium]|nr:hypothetical protein [Syntrophorhabdales bacterium]